MLGICLLVKSTEIFKFKRTKLVACGSHFRFKQVIFNECPLILLTFKDKQGYSEKSFSLFIVLLWLNYFKSKQIEVSGCASILSRK